MITSIVGASSDILVVSLVYDVEVKHAKQKNELVCV